MNIDNKLRLNISSAFKILYNYDVKEENIQIQSTSNEFKGYFTVILFQFAKSLKKNPDKIGNEIGEYLIKNSGFIQEFNVVRGFLNIDISKKSWINLFHDMYSKESWGISKKTNKEIMIEFSSPNTNKPLHLGHLRNIFLGHSVSKILEASGYKVHKVQIINDRGIHICKSMIAWKKFGNGETPESCGLKGDHLVGKYYVIYQEKFNEEVEILLNQGFSQEEAEKNSSIYKEAQKLLIKWEIKDSNTIELWKMMNGWVYDGFSKTYNLLEVKFCIRDHLDLREVFLMKLDQFLKWQGLVDTGGQAKQLIHAGEVTVNGKRETRRGRKLIHGDLICLAKKEYIFSNNQP